jgi:ribosomal protein L35AE/L33A
MVGCSQCAQNKRTSHWSPEGQTRVGQKREITFIRNAECKVVSVRVMQAHGRSGGVLRTSIHC